MAQQDYIKDLYEKEGKSLREIAKIVGKDFRTVQKYAYQEDWRPEVKLNMGAKNHRVLGAYIDKIDEWLEQDLKEPRKHRHTAKRVFDRLVKEEKYAGSYSCVKRYVVRKKIALGKRDEGYLPLAQPKAHAQVDFGDFKYYDGAGSAHEGHALIISFPYSNAGWMQVFKSENQESLLTGMKRIFYHINGVPVQARFDNMTTAVVHVLAGAERELTDGFVRFKLHHRFEAVFCNPDSGNEKGNVESKVGYTRRNMLVPVPVIDDFDAYNKGLLALCDADHAREHYLRGETLECLWEQEKGELLSLPEYEYEVFKYESRKVGKTGLVQVDTNRYGLSPELCSKTVQVKIFFDRVEFFYDRQPVASYGRSYGKNEEVYDWAQYVPTLVHKPGSAEHTRFFEQMPKLWREYIKTIKGKERRTALELLSEIVGDGNESLCDGVLELAGQHGGLEADSLRQCYLHLSKPENNPPPLKLLSNPPLINYAPDLTVYDGLTGGEGK